MRNSNVCLINSPNMKILVGDFDAKIGREDIFNRQFRMKIYTKLVVIIELD
jgi:hypothetical protein